MLSTGGWVISILVVHILVGGYVRNNAIAFGIVLNVMLFVSLHFARFAERIQKNRFRTFYSDCN